MKLLTKAIEKQLPDHNAISETPLKELKCIFKLFAPWSGYTFYVCSGEKQEDGGYLLWGLVTGLIEDEFGYTMLSEIEEVRGFAGLKIERDLYFDSKPLGEIAALKSYWERWED